MKKVVIGRHSLYSVAQQTFYGSDGLWLPEFDLFGLATSSHSAYNDYPIAERDVQLAFELIRQAAKEQLSGFALLQHLLKAVYFGFSQVDLAAHLTGIIAAYEPDHFLGRIDHPHSKPRVQLIVLQQQAQRLSLACIGNFMVYKVSANETKLLFGTAKWAGGDGWAVIYTSFLLEPKVRYQAVMPTIYAWETELEPGDMIVVCTPYTPITEINLAQLLDEHHGDLEAINHHFTTSVKASFTSPVFAAEYGVAWAMTRWEE